MSSTPMVSIMGVHIADMLIGITPKKKEELPWKCLQEMRTTKVRCECVDDRIDCRIDIE